MNERPLLPPPTEADRTPWCLLGKRYRPGPLPTPAERQAIAEDHARRLAALRKDRGK